MLAPRSSRFLPAGVLLLLLLPACKTTGSAADDGDAPVEPPEEQVDLSRYEDFDPAPYREEAPDPREEGIEHDVPASLMGGRADAGVQQTVQGYRVQVFSSRDKAAADDEISRVNQWWNANAAGAPEGLFSDDLPVYVVYRQPYYRVRIGNFTSRAEAERALQYLHQRYGDAFISRGQVTVTR